MPQYLNDRTWACSVYRGNKLACKPRPHAITWHIRKSFRNCGMDCRLTFGLHCKAIAALFFILCRYPIWRHCLWFWGDQQQIVVLTHLQWLECLAPTHRDSYRCSMVAISASHLIWCYFSFLSQKIMISCIFYTCTRKCHRHLPVSQKFDSLCTKWLFSGVYYKLVHEH